MAGSSAFPSLALSAVSSRCCVIPNLKAARYSRHMLHAEARAWVDKNCYVDIWIELLHALHLEPIALMPFTIAIDFEGDQWTFYKPPHNELRELYSIDVQELNVWRPLLDHTLEHLGGGRLISTEADAFWLPDTAGTDYRHQHAKTTIVLNEIDAADRTLGYFHNAGYFNLGGEDFDGVFSLGQPSNPAALPLFAELINVCAVVRRPERELVELSLNLWQRHLRRIPASNPVRRFQRRFTQDLPSIREKGLAHYHAWAFATTRQLGSAFEAAAINLRWLAEKRGVRTERSVHAFETLSAAAKAFILKGARAANNTRPFDSAEAFEQMANAWQDGVSALLDSPLVDPV